MSLKVAIVICANEGFGFTVVKEFCQKFSGIIYLTSSDEKAGETVVVELNKHGFKPEFHLLDVTKKQSVQDFANFIGTKYGGIDILINNNFFNNETSLYPTYEEAKRVVDRSYMSLLTISEILYPLLRTNGRVVNMISDCGHLSNIKNKYWVGILSKLDISMKELNDFLDWFLLSLKDGSFKKEDFAEDGVLAEYRVSLIAVVVLTFIQQRTLAANNISINCVAPGMSGIVKKEFMSPNVSSAVSYLALEASQSLKGTYVSSDKKLIDWYDYEGDYYCHRDSFKK